MWNINTIISMALILLLLLLKFSLIDAGRWETVVLVFLTR